MTRRISSRQSPGFTLLELLLYVSLVSIILLIISMFVSALLQSRVKNQTIAEVEQQGLFVMQTMTQTTRNALTVTAPATGTSAAAATLTVLDGTKSPTIFDLSGGVVRITEGAGTAVPVTSSRLTASALMFQNFSASGTPGTMRIQFTLTAVNPSGRSEFSYAKTFVGSATLRQP